MDFCENKHVKKTRKRHVCSGCCKEIPTGSEAYNIAAKFEGDFENFYLCVSCYEFMDKNPEDFKYGFYDGDIGERRRIAEQEGK